MVCHNSWNWSLNKLLKLQTIIAWVQSASVTLTPSYWSTGITLVKLFRVSKLGVLNNSNVKVKSKCLVQFVVPDSYRFPKMKQMNTVTMATCITWPGILLVTRPPSIDRNALVFTDPSYTHWTCLSVCLFLSLSCLFFCLSVLPGILLVTGPPSVDRNAFVFADPSFTHWACLSVCLSYLGSCWLLDPLP